MSLFPHPRTLSTCTFLRNGSHEMYHDLHVYARRIPTLMWMSVGPAHRDHVLPIYSVCHGRPTFVPSILPVRPALSRLIVASICPFRTTFVRSVLPGQACFVPPPARPLHALLVILPLLPSGRSSFNSYNNICRLFLEIVDSPEAVPFVQCLSAKRHGCALGDASDSIGWGIAPSHSARVLTPIWRRRQSSVREPAFK